MKLHFLLGLLLLVPGALAEIYIVPHTSTFTLSTSTTDLALCGCQSISDSLKVSNLGKSPLDILFEAQSDKPWITLGATTLHLEGGEHTMVPYAVAAPCGARGSSKFTIYATSTTGRHMEISRNIHAAPCQTVVASLSGPSSATPCSPTFLTLNLYNTGPFDDEFFIEAKPGLKSAQDRVQLSAGERKTMPMALDIDCGKSGDVALSLTVTAKASGATASASHKMYILPDYDFALTGPPSLAVCAQVHTTVPLKISNGMEFQNTFDAKMRAPNFVTISSTATTVAAQDDAQIMLRIYPAIKDVGLHAINLSVHARIGDTIRELSWPLHVERCYVHEASIRTISSPPCCGQHQFSIDLDNQGIFGDAYTIEIHGQGTSLSSQILELGPEEKKSIPLTIDGSCVDQTVEYFVIVRSHATNHSEQLALPIKTAQPSTCHALKMPFTDISMDQNTRVVKIPLVYDGQGTSTITLKLESDLLTLVNDTLELRPGQKVQLEAIPIAGSRYAGRYPATLTATFPDHTLTHRFFIVVAAEEPSRYVSLCATLAILIIIVLLFTIGVKFYDNFADAFSEKEVKIYRRRPRPKDQLFVGLVIIIALCALGLIILLLLARPVEPERLTLGTLEFATTRSTPITIDLTTLFFDPDGDSLQYRAAHTPNLDVTIHDGKATIIPDPGFVGVRQLKIEAADGKGGTTNSSQLTIFIHDTPRKTWFSMLKLWSHFLLWIVLCGAIALLIYTWYRRGYVTIKRD